ncbi:MAG: MFS transporter [Gemmataceae bacterium]
MSFRLSLMMFLQWAVPGTLVPLYSIRLQHDLGFSPALTGMCCATQAAAGVVSSLIAGQVADRYLSAEKSMSICAVLAGIDLCVLASLREPVGVFLATLFFWIVTGPMLLYGTTISFHHLPEPNRQFGPIRMWGTVGWMVIGWVMATWTGDPLHLGAAVAFLIAGYALTLPHTPPRRPTESSKRFAPLEAVSLLRLPAFSIYCICMFGACITFPFTTQNTPLLLRELGISVPWVTPTLTLAQTTEVVGLALLPALFFHLGVRGTMLLGLGAWLVAMCVLSVGKPLELVLASMGLNGLYITGFMVAGQVFVNSLAEGDFRASVQGLLGCINGIGTLVGNLLAGWLREWTEGRLPPTFAVAAGITATSLVLFLIAFQHRGHEVLRSPPP